MSFSRPDPASPAQVADASFSTGRRGFDQAEVRDFLRMVSAELGRLHERELFLERELQSAQDNPDLDSGRLDDEALTRLLGEETARVLNAARESAHEIREKAEQSAARMLLEASDEASRMREEAEIEASRRRTDAAADAEAELSMAKQQGREMVNEARAYRERVLSELARRRELAREQIEQLVHGRDRLMQAFERARLVAVDVVAEMQPLGEPDEYVNLQPSTGPVPVMVARQDVAALADPQAANSDPVAADPTQIEAVDAEIIEIDSVGVDPVDVEAEAEIEIEIEEAVEVETDVEVDVDVEEADAEAASDEHPSGRDELRLVTDADAAADDVVDTADAHDPDPHEPDADEPDDVALVDVALDDDPVVLDEADVEEALPVAEIAAPDAEILDAETEVVDSGQLTTDPSDEPADPDAGESVVEDRGDDVVVDLFARLRATTTVDVEPELAVELEDDLDAPPTALAHEAADEVADEVADTDEEIVDGAAITVFEQRDADLTPLIVSSARKLKRVLADEQNEVLDALRRSDPVRNLDALLPWSSHHAERYASVISDDLLLAANAGAATAVPGRAAKLRKAAGERAVNEAAQKLAQALIGPLRERLSRSISDGDGDNPAIAQKVRAVYRECKTRHIDEQLDDVVRTAHGRGVLGAFELDAPVQWTPDPSHEVCADCDDNRLAGVVAAGQQFPTGHVCTPAHPGCRCTLVPAGR